MKTTIKYNGVHFAENTPEKVMQICSNANRKNRFRFWYGDNNTGKSWNEENDVCGYIGRSTGIKKIPLLITKVNSYGGGGLLTDCIVKIIEIRTKKVVYQHDNFNQSLFVAEDCKVLQDGQIYANCKSEKQAIRLADFMNGKRMAK